MVSLVCLKIKLSAGKLFNIGCRVFKRFFSRSGKKQKKNKTKNQEDETELFTPHQKKTEIMATVTIISMITYITIVCGILIHQRKWKLYIYSYRSEEIRGIHTHKMPRDFLRETYFFFLFFVCFKFPYSFTKHTKKMMLAGDL